MALVAYSARPSLVVLGLVFLALVSVVSSAPVNEDDDTELIASFTVAQKLQLADITNIGSFYLLDSNTTVSQEGVTQVSASYLMPTSLTNTSDLYNSKTELNFFDITVQTNNNSFRVLHSNLVRNKCIRLKAPGSDMKCLSGEELSNFFYMDNVPYDPFGPVDKKFAQLYLMVNPPGHTSRFDLSHIYLVYFHPEELLFSSAEGFFPYTIPGTVAVETQARFGIPAFVMYDTKREKFGIHALGNLKGLPPREAVQYVFGWVDPRNPETSGPLLNYTYAGPNGPLFGASSFIREQGENSLGRVILPINFEFQAQVDHFCDSFNVSLNVPSWFNFSSSPYPSFPTHVVFSKEMEVEGIYAVPNWSSLGDCQFVDGRPSLLACTGSQVFRQHRYWDKAQVVVISIESNTVLSLPIEARDIPDPPSTSIRSMSVVRSNPCSSSPPGENELYFIISGSQGINQARTASVVRGSQSLIAIVNATSLVETVSVPPSISNTPSLTTKNGRRVVTIPDITRLDFATDEQLVSYTTTSTVEWNLHRNVVWNAEKLPDIDVYLLATEVRGGITHTKDADRWSWSEIQLTTACPSQDPGGNPKVKPNHDEVPTLVVLSVSTVIFIGVVIWILYKRGIQREVHAQRMVGKQPLLRYT